MIYSRVSVNVRYSLLVSWFIPYLQDLQPTYIGVTIHLLRLSTMDISVRVDTQDGPQNELYKEWNNSTYYRGEITPPTQCMFGHL